MVDVVSLQRVQEPTNIQVRRLSAITRKLQACPTKIVYQSMTPTGEIDLHSDSGYRRLSGDADDEGKVYGIRGANLLRRGTAPSGKPIVHLSDTHCKSHRLQARSIYSAETLAAAHNLEDCYPTIVTLRELHAGPMTAT
eukprot:7074287-Pyramimonas_sp.AAC.1